MTVAQERMREQLVAETPLVQVGRFCADPDSTLFREPLPPGHFAVVFPETAVRIRHRGSTPFVTDSSVVTFYNHDAEYRREVVDPRGDRCHWFSAREDLLRELVAESSGRTPSSGRLFPFESGPCQRRTFELERRLLAYLESDVPTDTLLLEETVFTLLEGTLREAYGACASHRRRRSTHRLSRPVRRAQEYLAAHFARRPKLDEIASVAGCSSYYLSRTFHQETGVRLHRYCLELALRAAYDQVVRGDRALSDIAQDCGFSSHSHLSERFRRRFGVPPTVARKQAGLPRRRLRSIQ